MNEAVIGEETSRRSGAISRVLSSLGITLESICHLSGIGVTTYLGAIYPPAGASNPRCAGIHDLATHKVYGSLYRYRLGELLPHLFTLTLHEAGRSFSVTLLPPRGQLPVRKYGALRCSDVPHLLGGRRRDRSPHCLLARYLFISTRVVGASSSLRLATCSATLRAKVRK